MLLHSQTSGTIHKNIHKFLCLTPVKKSSQNVSEHKYLVTNVFKVTIKVFFISITCITMLLINNVIKFPIWRILRLANKRVITRHHRSPQVCIALRWTTPHAECCTIQHDYILQISESGVNMFVTKCIYCFILSLVLSTSLRSVVSFDIHVQVCVILGFKKGQSQYSARSTQNNHLTSTARRIATLS